MFCSLHLFLGLNIHWGRGDWLDGLYHVLSISFLAFPEVNFRATVEWGGGIGDISLVSVMMMLANWLLLHAGFDHLLSHFAHVEGYW